MRKRRRYKPQIIEVNLSNSFTVRTRCVVCGKEPTIYYQNEKPYLFRDPRHPIKLFDLFKKWMKRMNQDWYMDMEPRYFTNLQSFSHPVDYKGFNPKGHNSNANPKNNLTEFISCWSGCTIWAFNDKSNKDRKEISQRKCRYTHPQKYIY